MVVVAARRRREVRRQVTTPRGPHNRGIGDGKGDGGKEGGRRTTPSTAPGVGRRGVRVSTNFTFNVTGLSSVVRPSVSTCSLPCGTFLVGERR